ncbi:MAG: type II toxin-antitoxin system Phd/YefM family antitoxin [Gammaproteobacteria bacterium]|jgi:prevent-host-death family protein
MATLPASKARSNLYNLIDEVSICHKPILITGKRHNAMLVSEDDWAALQETLYLLSIPNMRKSIRKGLETPLTKCDKELDW